MSTSVPDDFWLDVALSLSLSLSLSLTPAPPPPNRREGLSIAVAAAQGLSIAVAAMMMLRFFLKRVTCIPGTFVQPPERRARRTTLESASTKRNARSLTAHASVKLEACPANPKRRTIYCMK